VGLARRLGLFDATMIVMGGIIGSGIFFTPAEVARPLPTGSWVLAVWALGGVVALAGALTYAELGAMMPDAGGAYVYIRAAFGPLAAFLYGWMSLASIATGALAAVAMGFANSLGRLVPLDPLGGPLAVAAATILVLTVTNYLGIRPGAAVTNVLTVAKVAGVMAAKRTAELVPLCHPVPLTDVDVTIEMDDALPGLRVEAVAKTVAKTGVEMEAITAVSVTLITVYDMAKALDRRMLITDIRLLEKRGGRSGSWTRSRG
jgi:APA family basic amino acid/polyamine antiporter